MKRNNMYFDTQRAKVYKDAYRPSPNIYRFIRSLMMVIVEGQSPSCSYQHTHIKKRK